MFSNFLGFIKSQRSENYLKGSFLVMLTITIMTFTSLNTCLSVNIDGSSVGYITSNKIYDTAFAKTKNQIQEKTNLVIGDSYNQIEVVKTHKLFAKKMDVDGLVYALAENVEWLAQGTVLNINNGEIKFTLSDHNEGQKILDTLIAENTVTSDKTIIKSVDFVEEVALEDTNVRISQIQSADQVLSTIKQGKEAEKIHQVVENESLWLIARNNNLSVEELKSLNPQLTTERLQIGQELKLTKIVPLVNVAVTKEVTAEESIAFETKYVDSSKLLRGEQKVTTKGQKGKKQITYEITESNGIALAKNVLNEKIVAEPVQQVVEKGTSTLMVASSRGGSGALSWPIKGKITSPYGKRSRGYHTGIDINANTGNPIASAAGGKVVSAGWAGGYGYCIVVDHGNGLKTRYAHLSKILVSNGDTVLRNQVIGRAGSTGNSTGPHLHFEVLVNGSHKNPINYLN